MLNRLLAFWFAPRTKPEPSIGSGLERKSSKISALTFEKSRSKRYDACSDVVRVKGFEPPTYWFVASHSIQLSYTRILLETVFLTA